MKLLVTFEIEDGADTFQCWFDVRNRRHAEAAIKLKQDKGHKVLHAELCQDGTPLDIPKTKD